MDSGDKDLNSVAQAIQAALKHDEPKDAVHSILRPLVERGFSKEIIDKLLYEAEKNLEDIMRGNAVELLYFFQNSMSEEQIDKVIELAAVEVAPAVWDDYASVIDCLLSLRKLKEPESRLLSLYLEKVNRFGSEYAKNRLSSLK